MTNTLYNQLKDIEVTSKLVEATFSSSWFTNDNEKISSLITFTKNSNRDSINLSPRILRRTTSEDTDTVRILPVIAREIKAVNFIGAIFATSGFQGISNVPVNTWLTFTDRPVRISIDSTESLVNDIQDFLLYVLTESEKMFKPLTLGYGSTFNHFNENDQNYIYNEEFSYSG